MKTARTLVLLALFGAVMMVVGCHDGFLRKSGGSYPPPTTPGETKTTTETETKTTPDVWTGEDMTLTSDGKFTLSLGIFPATEDFFDLKEDKEANEDVKINVYLVADVTKYGRGAKKARDLKKHRFSLNEEDQTVTIDLRRALFQGENRINALLLISDKDGKFIAPETNEDFKTRHYAQDSEMDAKSREIIMRVSENGDMTFCIVREGDKFRPANDDARPTDRSRTN